MSGSEEDQWLLVGRVGAPFGVRGEVRVHPFSEEAVFPLHFDRWRLRLPDGGERTLSLVAGRAHGKGLVARLAGVDSPEGAALLRGAEILVDRRLMPAPDGDEGWYWVDLVGCAVEEEDGRPLGVVESLLATGANDVLVVREEAGTERLLPFIEDVVLTVDVQARRVVVRLLEGL